MFRFEAMNGCSLCNAMEGFYAEEPERPHPYCRCVISEVDDEDDDVGLTAPASGRPGGFDRVGHGWAWNTPEVPVVRNSDEDEDGYGETYRIDGTLVVECCDGETVTGDDYELEVVVLEPGPDEDFRELWEEAMLAAEAKIQMRVDELKDADCDPCDLVS